MAKLYLLCGIQGSGKSTYAKHHQAELKAKIVSTDYIRQNYQPIEEKDVFPKAYQLAAEYLNNDINVIFDATNITKAVRKKNRENIEKLLNKKVDVICLCLNTKLDICIERVKIRNQQMGQIFIPLDVIENYSKNIELPDENENFDELIIIENYKI